MRKIYFNDWINKYKSGYIAKTDNNMESLLKIIKYLKRESKTFKNCCVSSRNFILV